MIETAEKNTMQREFIKTLEYLKAEQVKYLNEIQIKVIPIKTIEIHNLADCNLNQFPLDLPKKGATTIYIIKAQTKLDYEEISNRRNQLAKNYQMSRVIKNNWTVNKDNCLYVGRSDDIASRLKQHLFLERPSTYALRLKKLLEMGKITIEIYKFDNNSKDVQIFEDLLWEYYRPLFGRQGSK